MAAVEASLHQQIGRLIATVEGLQQDFRRSEQKSDASRAAMHRRLDEVVERVGRQEGEIATARIEIDQMRPVTDDVRKWKLMGLGALGVVGIGGTAFGVSIAGVLERMAHFLRTG